MQLQNYEESERVALIKIQNIKIGKSPLHQKCLKFGRYDEGPELKYTFDTTRHQKYPYSLPNV